MYKVRKREGKIVPFEISKIADAITKAFEAEGKNYDENIVDFLALKVTSDFESKIKDNIINVEDIQDSVESVLIKAGYAEVAKAYIILKNDYLPAEKEKVMKKIKEYCEKNLAHYSIPYKYEFLKEFPKTPYGKVDFRKLQKKANEEKD